MESSVATATFRNSFDLRHDGEQLRNRVEAESYLFVRGLLPAEEVLAVRASILEVIETFGWRASDQGALGGRLNLDRLNQVPSEEMRVDIGVSGKAYEAIQKLECVHRLPHHPALLDFFRTLLDGEVLVHPRHIVRAITGHTAMVPTPAHQDFPLIQGTPRTWTCWFPLGDCPKTSGGLTVLRDSHRNGYLPVQPALGAGGIEVGLCDFETDWVSGNFQAGDVLVFPSYTVHKALPSQHKDMIRLSLDVRYQRADEEVEEKSLLPHCGLSWDEIYADWASKDLCYYWRKFDLTPSLWNPDLFQPARRIC